MSFCPIHSHASFTSPSSTLEMDQPMLALQVTLFPDQGIAVGITALHTAADGSSSSHFMRTWASINNPKGEAEEPPFYDRSRISEPVELQSPLFSKIKQTRSILCRSLRERSRPDLVRATFRLSTEQIEDLRRWVEARASNGSDTRFSSFTLAVALVWTCLLNARGCTPREMEWLLVTVNCRARLNPNLPSSYFGNGGTGCLVEAEGRGSVGEQGLAAAAMAIREALRGFPTGVSALREMFEIMVGHSHRLATMRPFSLAGSPRLRVYEVDFGWGKPSKVEVVSIDANGAMSLSEMKSVDGSRGGLEIGLALPVGVMEEFVVLFRTTLKNTGS